MFPLALPQKANETLQVLERISGIPGISSPTIPPFSNHAGNVVKSPLPLLYQLSILRRDLFTYAPPSPIKSTEIESIADTTLSHFPSLRTSLSSPLLFYISHLWAIRPPPLQQSSPFFVSTTLRRSSSKTFPLSGPKDRERKRERDTSIAKDFSRMRERYLSVARAALVASVIPLVFFRNEREAVRSCKQFNINRPCFEFNGNERIR